jgi:N-acyl homoserine lactone hydrolase
MNTVSITKKSVSKQFTENLRSQGNVELKRIVTGTVITTKKGMENTSDKGTQDLPVYVYLIKHPKHGYYLIDAGLDKSFETKGYGTQKGLIRNLVACQAYQEKDQNIAHYLRQNHIDLSGVILSHLHFDHIGGMLDLDTVHDCFVGKGDKYNKNKPLYYFNYLKHITTLHELDFSQCEKLEPLGKAIDFFEDGSLIIVSTPGHTRAHLSFLVNTCDGYYFIAGDAYGYKRKSLINNGAGTYSENKQQANQTLKDILAFAKKHPKVTIMTGHGE